MGIVHNIIKLRTGRIPRFLAFALVVQKTPPAMPGVKIAYSEGKSRKTP